MVSNVSQGISTTQRTHILMRTPILTLTCALSIAVAAAAAAVAAADANRFVLAIVRPDGGLVPVAAYDTGRWQHAWPEPNENRRGTVAIDNIPGIWRKRSERVPRTWMVWPASGAKPIRAQVTGAVRVDAHCLSQLALATDLPATDRPQRLELGVAVDSDVPLITIGKVRHSDPKWRVAARAVLPRFSKLETAQGRTDRQQPRDPSAPIARLTALYAQTDASLSSSPMYFVAEKNYGAARYPTDATCAAVTIITGWLLPNDANPDAVALRGTKVFLTDCDATEAHVGRPLAAVQVGGQLFWLVQDHGYEGERYIIDEIRQTGVREAMQFYGGGC
jgi:hypothetical protein